jgi:hypothetical protein
VKLTEEQLRSIEQWAACDLREREGADVQALVDEVRALRRPESETLDVDIAFVDRAVAARILDMRRDSTLDGIPISEDNHKEMLGVTRAWERIRNLLGRR